MHALDSSTVAYECGCGLIHPGSSQRALNGGTYNGNETEEWENAKGTHRPCRWERLSAIPSSRPSGRRAPRSRVARAEWRPDPPRRGRVDVIMGDAAHRGARSGVHKYRRELRSFFFSSSGSDHRASKELQLGKL